MSHQKKPKDQIIYELAKLAKLAKLAIEAFNDTKDKHIDITILEYLNLGNKYINYDKQGYDTDGYYFEVDKEALEALKEAEGE